MQKRESGKSNLELPAFRVAGANSMSRKHRKSLIALALIAACSLSLASAQETNKSKPEQASTPAITKKVINLWPGVAPGSEQWKQPETNLVSGGMETTVNVSTPTLTAYLPDPSIATGTAVIIAPGGGAVGKVSSGLGVRPPPGRGAAGVVDAALELPENVVDHGPSLPPSRPALGRGRLLAPVARPYLRMRAFEGVEFTLETVSVYATNLTSYAAAGTALWGPLTQRHLDPGEIRDTLFPGLTVLVLGILGLGELAAQPVQLGVPPGFAEFYNVSGKEHLSLSP